MLLFNLLVSCALAQTSRIESRQIDLSQSSKIYLKPGLISVVEFPQSIIEVRLGNPNELKAIISQISPRELTIYFKNSAVSATNLIVRADRKTYVFDIIPDLKSHQDYIKVGSSFGFPQGTGNYRLKESILISPAKKSLRRSQENLQIEESQSL